MDVSAMAAWACERLLGSWPPFLGPKTHLLPLCHVCRHAHLCAHVLGTGPFPSHLDTLCKVPTQRVHGPGRHGPRFACWVRHLPWV